MDTHLKLFLELTEQSTSMLFSEHLSAKCHQFSHISPLWNEIWGSYNFPVARDSFLAWDPLNAAAFSQH